MRHVLRTSAVVAAAVLLLAGCAAGPAEAPTAAPSSTTSMPTSMPTSTPSETSAAPGADLADPASWTISDAGIGPILIGGDFDATLAELPTSWTSDGAACSWAAFWNAADASFSMHFVRGAEEQSDPISEVSASTTADAVTDPVGPMTEDGFGVGATRAEILAAHPDAEQGEGTVDGEWIRLASDTDAHVFFQFLDGADKAWAVTVTTRDEPSYEVCG